jgi:8-oxo-dGTP diphosphatase
MLHMLARGVILLNNHVLVAKAVNATTTFLPGGHVEVGESMPATLEREPLEELGLAVKVERYLGAIEHSYGSPEEYGINHVFAATCELKEIVPLVSKEAHLEFLWLSLDNLEVYTLLPFSVVQLVRGYAEGKTESFWASTFAT